MPPEYERETSRKVQGLIGTLYNDRQLRTDADQWDSLDSGQKREVLTRWLNVMTVELGMPGQHGFTIEGNDNRLHVELFFGSDEQDNTRYTLSTDKNILAGEPAMRKLEESKTLYEALHPVLHEVMHMYEARYANSVLQSRTAGQQEREYAMKVASSTMARKPATGPEYGTLLTESSAIYFSEQYVIGMRNANNAQLKKGKSRQ